MAGGDPTSLFSDSSKGSRYLFSEEIKEPYDTLQEYISMFKPRLHKNAVLADMGSWRLREDWVKLGGYCTNGSLDSLSGNNVALFAPESLPERLEMAGYTAEYAYFLDDTKDDPSEWQHSSHGELNSQILPDSANIKARIAHNLLKEDEVFGKNILNFWDNFMSNKSEKRVVEHKSLEDYSRWRSVDAAAEWWIQYTRFTAGLKLTREEYLFTETIKDLTGEILALTNDFYSWNKEYAVYQRHGNSGQISNAVYYLSTRKGIDFDEAKVQLVAKITDMERRFCEIRDSSFTNSQCTLNSRRWIVLLELMIAGCALWGSTAPRYNPTAPVPLPPVEMSKDQIPSESLKHEETSESFMEEENTPVKQTIEINEDLVLEPYEYIISQPSKGFIAMLIDGLNVWYRLPIQTSNSIRKMVDLLHHSALMIDDVEDGSSLRRGIPASHTIYGTAQAINCSNFMMIKAIGIGMEISTAAAKVCIEALQELHVGQGHDIHWTYHKTPPTEHEYFEMVSKKTGGFFRLVSRIFQVQASQNTNLRAEKLMTTLGQYFQIRDDYMNLTSSEYTSKKGYCDDLDEGKFSLPIIHALEHSKDKRLLSIMKGRTHMGMPVHLKELILKLLEETGSLYYTLENLRERFKVLEKMMDSIEEQTGTKNWVLRLLLLKLHV